MIVKESRIDRIIKLQYEPQRIRNISIVAHVDHGKTTLADSLISANGIISKKQAGNLKYLDDRVDEQDRGITMKSSSISLLSTYQEKDYLINLIDSPGHVEFGFEVSAALRLTDGALVVVDAIEGVSSQTYRVLLQTFQQRVSSILVLNKIDKLIRERQMSPLEAYRHLCQIIEQVNAILGSFINMKANEITADKSPLRKKSSRELQASQIQENQMNQLEKQFYFSVEKNNIVFCSAIDGWAFTTKDFSPLIAQKLQLDEAMLNKYLWGDYYINPKTKVISPNPINQNDKPLCVDFILQSIWDVYQKVFEGNVQKIQKIIKFFNLKISEKVKTTFDYSLVKEILNSWLPLDKVIFRTVIQSLPSPIKAQRIRLQVLFNDQNNEFKVKQDKQAADLVKRAVANCENSPEAPVVAFISKMVTVPKGNFNERGLNEMNPNIKDRTIGFGRVYSGILKRGHPVLVIGPKPKKIEKDGVVSYEWDVTEAIVENVYILMAQLPEGVKEVPAGNLVGIGNLDNIIFKTGTVTTLPGCPSMSPPVSASKSVLKVAVTTPNLQNAPKLIQGLKKLNKSDPSIEVSIGKNGDIILNTCGQVHLERCIMDLQNIFAKVEVKHSDPIINYRETITWSNLSQMNNEQIIKEMISKKREQLKKQIRERIKKEMLEDAEIDEQEKLKLRAIDEWQPGVEKYESDDLTVTDTRFFLKTREEEQIEKEKYDYKKEKEFKKTDYRNRGKTTTKQKAFLNLSEKTNIVTVSTPNTSQTEQSNAALCVKIRAIGFPFEVAQFIEKNSDKMKEVFGKEILTPEKVELGCYLLKRMEEMLMELNADKSFVTLFKQNLFCFGPASFGPNILMFRNMNPACSLYHRFVSMANKIQGNMLEVSPFLESIYCDYSITEKQLLNSVALGFDLAVQSGPLCQQPMMGACFIIQDFFQPEKITQDINEILGKKEKKTKKEETHKTVIQEQPEKEVERKIQEKSNQESVEKSKEQEAKEEVTSETVKETKEPEQAEEEQVKEQKDNQTSEKQKSMTSEKKTVKSNNKEANGPLVGQVISTVKSGCLQAFIGAKPHLVQPVYECNLQTHQLYYGNVHTSLAKRKAKILDEDLHESSNLFLIKAHLPVKESFGFCNEMLTTTQGRVNAQLFFDTWKIITEDPFYTPLSRDEIEENGVENIMPNDAKKLIDKIRRDKGLVMTTKIVAAAQKQRTLSKR